MAPPICRRGSSNHQKLNELPPFNAVVNWNVGISKMKKEGATWEDQVHVLCWLAEDRRGVELWVVYKRRPTFLGLDIIATHMRRSRQSGLILLPTRGFSNFKFSLNKKFFRAHLKRRGTFTPLGLACEKAIRPLFSSTLNFRIPMFYFESLMVSNFFFFLLNYVSMYSLESALEFWKIPLYPIESLFYQTYSY